MRSMLLSIMFCLISSISWGETVSWADLVENPGDGLVYKKFRDVPFTGVVMATADDPIQRSYKDGVKHGRWVEFDANGLVKTKSEFSEGQLQKKVGFENGKETTEERFSYYGNGQLEYKYNFKDGQEHGLQESYNESGQLKRKGNYKNGKKHGLQKSYYESGQLEYKLNYKDGELHWQSEHYYENGQLSIKVNFKDGEQHGLYQNYYENGQLKFTSNYKDGKGHGLTEGYYENGKLAYQNEFRDGKLYKNDQLASGVFKYFYSEGVSNVSAFGTDLTI